MKVPKWILVAAAMTPPPVWAAACADPQQRPDRPLPHPTSRLCRQPWTTTATGSSRAHCGSGRALAP